MKTYDHLLIIEAGQKDRPATTGSILVQFSIFRCKVRGDTHRYHCVYQATAKAATSLCEAAANAAHGVRLRSNQTTLTEDWGLCT